MQAGRTLLFAALAILWPGCIHVASQPSQPLPPSREASGIVLNEKSEAVVGAAVTATWPAGQSTVLTGTEGRFTLLIPPADVTVSVSGRWIAANQLRLPAAAPARDLTLHIRYTIPAVNQSLVIAASTADPAIDRRNEATYRNTLFLRDDQLFETLDSGINAGQHEGGGKSVEVRRFGFNLDHGGLNGGLKVLVDDIPQNQATQGHGQGYLGSLKSISPELVEGVDMINGPFRAEYGDFSALGVVHIRLREKFDEEWTLRAQGGSFNSWRTFAAFSPRFKTADGFVAWEHAYTDGPFLNPLHYARENVTANVTRRLGGLQSFGYRFIGGLNSFDSSGQIPLDKVYSGALNRFGFMDPADGGRVHSATGAVYYRRDTTSGGAFRADAFLNRSLFDLFSDFTFFLSDPVHGDGIQQHDSRLQEGGTAQYLRAGKFGRFPALFIFGGNLTASSINVGLFHQKDRHIIAPVPGIPQAKADVSLLNPAVYVQEGLELPHLHADFGLRFDAFRFDVTDRIAETSSLDDAAGAEPKVNVVYTPSAGIPVALHFDYGRALTSQDARGIALDPSAPRAAATSFYMIGTSHQLRRFSASTDAFLIDREHEDVYDPDNGTMQYQGPTRSYGWEVRMSAQITTALAWNAGLTQVINAFFLGTAPRQYVDSAPHSVGNSSLTLAAWRGLSGSVRYRHISRYLLVNPDTQPAPPAAPWTDAKRAWASGLDVLDLAATGKLRRGFEWNFSADNLNNKRYYETQNLFDSRVASAEPAEARVHGTPGYPSGFTAGMTWRFE